MPLQLSTIVSGISLLHIVCRKVSQYERLLQVEDAPNLIGAVLDAAKSLPSMSYDIMTWAILDRLEDTSRSKIKVCNYYSFSSSFCGPPARHC